MMAVCRHVRQKMAGMTGGPLNVTDFIPRPGTAPRVPMDLPASLALRAPRRIRELQSRTVGRGARAVFKSFADPSGILETYLRRARSDKSGCVATLSKLSMCFSPNSLWATADRQRVVSSNAFKCLVADVVERLQTLARLAGEGDKTDAHLVAKVRVLGACGLLEYRADRLLDLLKLSSAEIGKLRLDSLGLVGHAMGVVNWQGPEAKGVFEEALSRSGRDDKAVGAVADAHVFSSMAHAGLKIGQLDASVRKLAARSRELLATVAVPPDGNDSLGWTGYMLKEIEIVLNEQSTMSGTRKEKTEEEQEELLQWLEEYGLKGQRTVGVDLLQKDVSDVLERLKIEFKLNCSVDYVFFAPIQINNTVLLCEDMKAVRHGHLSGMNALKGRVFKQKGMQVGVVHWDKWRDLEDEQKEIYLLRLLHELKKQKYQQPAYSQLPPN